MPSVSRAISLPLLFSLLLLPPAARAQSAYGPIISHTVQVQWPKNNVVLKGITVETTIKNKAPAEPQAKDKKSPVTHWLSIDLRKEVEIHQIVIKHAGGRESKSWNTRVFTVKGASNLNGPWTVLAQVTDNKKNVSRHKVKPTMARYVQLDIYQAEQNGISAARIYSLEVLNEKKENVALTSKGALAVASHTTNGRELAKCAIDGNEKTKWCGLTKVRTNIAASSTMKGDGAILFDTELCRYAASWTGGMLTFNGVVFNGRHGSNPSPVTTPLTATLPTPGFAKNGSFKDPRAIPHGPLPKDHARYRGFYLHDDKTVFFYTVGTTEILDCPGMEQQGSAMLTTRTLNLKPHSEAIEMLVCDVPNGKGAIADNGSTVTLEAGEAATAVSFAGEQIGKLKLIEGTRVVLELPPATKATKVKIAIATGGVATKDALKKAIAKSESAQDLKPLTKGGKPRWTDTVTTEGIRAKDDAAYVVDSITPPLKNPYGARMRIGGFDFFSDGRAAISTWDGDVWIVSGIDEKLKKVTWKRFANGIFHGLGLKIVDDIIYVHGRDQITRLHDLNNDDEADFYECFNNDILITKNFHEFAYDLQTDKQGNFYFTKGGPVRPGGRGWDKLVPHHGCLFRLSKDGSKLEVIARGHRAPNGLGIGPNGELTTGDNEGTWTPKCPINWVKPNGFYGVLDFMPDPKPEKRDPPLCWMPKGVDNSGGGQVWITSDSFGPLSGQLLHMSYGTCKLYRVLKEEVNGIMQGGVVELPLRFDSGINRARFHKGHNALYITGLRGWQTRASKNGGFYRVRYTGKKICQPAKMRFRPNGIELTFTEPLNKEAAEDIDNYNIEWWNYRWTKAYGSKDYKVSNPKRSGHDPVDLESAKLSANGKTVFLTTADPLEPVDQIQISYTLKDATDKPIRQHIYGTINTLPKK